ncbi:MAG: S-layer homology domain-containing protein [Candidatus Peribacteria bacterium]|nr:S-layer homology domain-containing protein [Candidatus Peribacteria bacterium]
MYERAKENGLTSMQTYEDFRPNDEITRAEMAKIVSLYAERFFTSTSFRSE